jgi:hypothetical protein
MGSIAMKAARHQHDGVEIVRLGRSDWRVNDATDASLLLGYIERQRSGRYEVMWMTDPMRWGYASSFEDALGAFGEGLRFAGEVFDRRAQAERPTHGRRAVRRSTWIKSSRHPSVA